MKNLIQAMLTLLLGLSIATAAHAGEKSESHCEVSGLIDRLTCPYETVQVAGPNLYRNVKYSIPRGKAPKAGWPTVIIYQGSFFPVEFSRSKLMPFGGYNEIRLIQSLLDHGFAVIAPPAIEKIAWMTNLIGIDYNTSEDFYFIENLLERMEEGDFGKLNMNRLYATGISSGGYHSSRMAVSFPGRFKALAVNSASYATCGGPMCFVPNTIPAGHPATIFLHGRLDTVVPLRTMYPYYSNLLEHGVDVDAFVSSTSTHQWLDEAPELITNWFLKHK